MASSQHPNQGYQVTPAVPTVPPYVPMSVPPYVPIPVPPNNGSTEVLRRQVAWLDNLGTNIDKGRNHEKIVNDRNHEKNVNDRRYSPSRRYEERHK